MKNLKIVFWLAASLFGVLRAGDVITKKIPTLTFSKIEQPGNIQFNFLLKDMPNLSLKNTKGDSIDTTNLDIYVWLERSFTEKFIEENKIAGNPASKFLVIDILNLNLQPTDPKISKTANKTQNIDITNTENVYKASPVIIESTKVPFYKTLLTLSKNTDYQASYTSNDFGNEKTSYLYTISKRMIQEWAKAKRYTFEELSKPQTQAGSSVAWEGIPNKSPTTATGTTSPLQSPSIIIPPKPERVAGVWERPLIDWGRWFKSWFIKTPQLPSITKNTPSTAKATQPGIWSQFKNYFAPQKK